MQFETLHGDCVEVMRGMPDNSVDSIVCDPPYELTSGNAKVGFMGKAWDGSGIAFSVEMWAEALRVLKPGGHLLAFSGSRTYHRMVVAIEDAGFEIRDQIMWVYGSGFPKSLDVSKAIDKTRRRDYVLAAVEMGLSIPGNNLHDWTKADHAPGDKWWGEFKQVLTPEQWGAIERAVIGQKSVGVKNGAAGGSHEYGLKATEVDVTAPATDAARQWDGWGTALKPAHEPICVARKPLHSLETNVLQVVESQLRAHGVLGEIVWKTESANGAGKAKRPPNSSKTPAPQAGATSAANAAANVMPNAAQPNPNNSPTPGSDGPPAIPAALSSIGEQPGSAYVAPCLTPTAEVAFAAASRNAIFSPSTTSQAAELPTEKRSTEKCTPNSDEQDSRPATASYAGIATGLPGSMATVRIMQDESGAFLWPAGLPKIVPGSPLTVAANVLAHGTGALNIDGCRVGDEPITQHGRSASANRSMSGANYAEEAGRAWTGRWPANIIHDGSDEVVALFPESTSGAVKAGTVGGHSKGREVYGDHAGYEIKGIEASTGSAARFFYCAKASKKDRNEGCESMPLQVAGGMSGRSDGSMGSVTYNNIHPTVKPTDLMAYLVRLVTPPGGLVLDPFMGSGSTGKAAMREGFRFIGIEQQAEYIAIARARIEHELIGDIL